MGTVSLDQSGQRGATVTHTKTQGVQAKKTAVPKETHETQQAHTTGKTATVAALDSHPAAHGSSPEDSKHVTQQQSDAAGHILTGVSHETHQAGTGTAGHETHDAGAETHGDGHGEEGGHGEDPVAKGGQKVFEAADYANQAMENLGHRLQHGKGHGHGGHTESHGATTEAGHGTPADAHGTGSPKTETPAAPPEASKPATAPSEPVKPAAPEKPPVQVREAHGEMAEMVENMKRNGADIPEPTKPTPPKLEPTGEMAEYVENIKAAQERELAAYRSSRKTSVPAAAEGLEASAPAAKLAKGVTGVETAGEATTKSVSSLARVGARMTKAAGVAEGVLGPLGVYFGVKEIGHGLHEMHEAKTKTEKYDAGSTIAIGAGTTTVGAAGTGTAVLSALKGAGAIAQSGTGAAAIGVLGKVSVVAAGGVAVIDGAKDIVHGFQDGDAGEVGKGTLKTAAGGAMLIGVATGNPVLVAGGAITYAGVTIYENRKEIAAFAGHVADKAVEVGGAIKDGVVGGVTAAKDFAGNTGGAIADGLGSAWKAATSWW